MVGDWPKTGKGSGMERREGRGEVGGRGGLIQVAYPSSYTLPSYDGQLSSNDNNDDDVIV